MTVGEYRRRLSATPVQRPEVGPSPSRAVLPADAVSDDEVRAARTRYPRAFAAIESDAHLPAAEVWARERLVTLAIRVGYLPPE